MMARAGAVSYRIARRVVIAVVGGTLLLVGIVMLVAPGPGLVVIPLALAVLGAEFAWARFWLRRLKARLGPERLREAGRGLARMRERLGRLFRTR